MHEPGGGEAIYVVIVSTTSSLSEADIIAFADEHLADYKKPKSVEFVDEAQKTLHGKQDNSVS
ncbi:AMP-binding enzyme [Natrinema gelatinilyticum]|uniref:AMP-binding enzyme n=1 Tax=Natrinema gelatinilyticum TaxID=2961571 RepID=UPI003CE55E5A